MRSDLYDGLRELQPHLGLAVGRLLAELGCVFDDGSPDAVSDAVSRVLKHGTGPSQRRRPADPAVRCRLLRATIPAQSAAQSSLTVSLPIHQVQPHVLSNPL